jgi:DNA-binding XRE family transcriptional regulator
MVRHSDNPLRKLRFRAGFETINEAAAALQISAQTLYNLETTNKMPGIRLALRMAIVYQCSLDDIYKDYLRK